MKIEKVIFHTRFRDLAFNALEAILELKKAGLKEVVLTYVIPREEVAFVPYGGYLKDEAERLEEVARLRFEQWQEFISGKGLQSKVRIETGSLNGRILAVAEEEKADLIVTGRKKRTAFEKVYVGSHVLDIIRRSPLPVMMGKYMVQYEWAGEVLTRVNDHIFDRPRRILSFHRQNGRGNPPSVAGAKSHHDRNGAHRERLVPGVLAGRRFPPGGGDL